MNEITIRGLLADRISDTDFVDWACKKEGIFRFVVYQGLYFMNGDLTNLDLSVRSYNVLRRQGFETVNDMVNSVERFDDFAKIRNLGRRSSEEIMLKLFLQTYEHLKPEKRKAYLDKVRAMN